MPTKVTVERVLRDEDDDSGQTVRSWRIEAEKDHMTIRAGGGSATGFILIRASDVEALVEDLLIARDTAARLALDPAGRTDEKRRKNG